MRSKHAEPFEPLISQQELLRMLGISVRQLHRLLKTADDRGNPQVPLPHHIVGASRKFLASEVRAWLRISKERRTTAR